MRAERPHQFVAVDWSGRRSGEGNHIYAAIVRDGVVVDLSCGRTRPELIDWLTKLVEDEPRTVIGLDFSFSFPQWFVVDSDCRDIDEVWSLVEESGEEWLSQCPQPFWGHRGRRRGDHDGYRISEQRCAERFGITPKSIFQIAGAGSVGTASLRGMPYLRQLRAAGMAIWPFDEPRLPMVLEVYPRLFANGAHKTNESSRRQALDRLGLAQAWAARATMSEDAFDAVVTALGMAGQGDSFARLRRSGEAALEGEMWLPER